MMYLLSDLAIAHRPIQEKRQLPAIREEAFAIASCVIRRCCQSDELAVYSLIILIQDYRFANHANEKVRRSKPKDRQGKL
jgi:hypothetical protein